MYQFEFDKPLFDDLTVSIRSLFPDSKLFRLNQNPGDKTRENKVSGER